jgi:hypothetical protein
MEGYSDVRISHGRGKGMQLSPGFRFLGRDRIGIIDRDIIGLATWLYRQSARLTGRK